MSSAQSQLASELLAPTDRSEFLRRLAGVDSANIVAVAIDFEALSKSTVMITKLEIASRIDIMLAATDLSSDDVSRLILASSKWSAENRNVLARALAPTDRRRLFSANSEQATPATEPITIDARAATDAEGPKGVTGINAWTDDAAPPPQVPTGGFSPDFRTVILLGSRVVHDANAALLKNNEFAPQIVEKFEELDLALETATDICGILLDDSFAVGRTQGEQTEMLIKVGSYSTVAWLRIRCGNLLLSTDAIRRALLASRHDTHDTPGRQINLVDSSALYERELEDLKLARELLANGESTRLDYASLNHGADLLLGAASAQQAMLHSRHARTDTLSIEFLQGGYSGALVIKCEPFGGVGPRVVKLGDKASIVDEARRFKTYISAHDASLAPVLAFHRSRGAIAFRSVAAEPGNTNSAKSLGDWLEETWNTQLFSPSIDLTSRCGRLLNSIVEAVDLLRAINLGSPANPNDISSVNPTLEQFNRLEASGFEWGFPASVMEKRESARTRFKKLERSAVVHGDVHLGNILVSDSGRAHLIDYAASGPGHPCLDLVRLELALLLGSFRLTSSVDDFLATVRAVEDQVDEQQLLNAIDEPTKRCHVNRVCILGASVARRRAIECARAHDGGEEDYRAAKLLLAWQNMAMPRRQAALARVIIEWLSPLVSE